MVEALKESEKVSGAYRGVSDEKRSFSRAPKGITREQILEAALLLFLKNSYAGTSTRLIAEALDMSKANLYHHFPVKEGLLHALLDPLFDQVDELLGHHRPAPNSSPEQREFLEEYFDLILECRLLVTLLASDPGVLAVAGIGDRTIELNDRLTALVAGSEPGVEGQVKAACALGALQTAAIRFYQADSEAVRRAGLEAAFAVLGDK
ncbi:MAG: TetR/AcrR family transcriptional regulator [Rubrobacteraceae bacterium]